MVGEENPVTQEVAACQSEPAAGPSPEVKAESAIPEATPSVPEAMPKTSMELLKKLRELNASKAGLIKESKDLFAKINEADAKARVLKSERDKLNLFVKKLSQEKNRLDKRIKSKMPALEKLKKSIDKKKESMSGTYKEIKQEINRLDWVVQTEVLNPVTEDRLSRMVWDLEAELTIAKKLDAAYDKVRELYEDIADIQFEKEQTEDLMLDLNQQATAKHDELMVIVGEVRHLRGNMRKLSKKINGVRKSSDKLYAAYKVMLGEEREKLAERRKASAENRKKLAEKRKADAEERKKLVSERKNKETEEAAAHERRADDLFEQMKKGKKIVLVHRL